MSKTSKLWVVLLVWTFSVIAHADSDTPSPVFTGTVNIVLANSNGIVVITDSNQTRMGRPPSIDPRPGQKLFRIDDRTVCTIAGFGSTSLPRFSEINSSAAGVLDAYVEELRRKGGTHSFHEKLTSLVFVFDSLLTGIGNLQQLDSATVEQNYGFELILAGYDTDGTPKIGKFKLSTHLSDNGVFSPVIKEIHETTVGRELEHETAGVGGGAVENVLSYPGKLEPEFARYAASRVSDHGSSLTVAEMETLAKSLAHLSALVNSHTYSVLDNFGFIHFQTFWPVGGSDQVAILEKGSLAKLDQPTTLVPAM